MTACRCGSTDRELILLSHGPHYAAEICQHCGRHFRWVAKPNGRRRHPRPRADRRRRHAGLVSRFGPGACELCGQTTDRLERHHVLEWRRGGDDEPANIWIVCVACHQFIHIERRRVSVGIRGQGPGS